MKDANMSELPLITFRRISLSWEDLEVSRLHISFNISSKVIRQKVNIEMIFNCTSSAKKLGRFLFSRITFKVTPLFFFSTLFLIRNTNIFPSLFFSPVSASSVLIPALIHSCFNKLHFVYLTIISHLAFRKSWKFPISEGKQIDFKEFP